jgi:periplasmic copper chaperone A
MRGFIASLILAMLAFVPVLTVAHGSPPAHKAYTIGALRISQVWTPVPPGGAQAAGGYLTITNTGSEPDTLTGGTAAVAARIEVHEMSMDGGVMRMRELKPGLVIKPGETVMLRPGSFHLMLMDLKEQPVQGRPFKGTLVFEKAGTVDVEYQVEPFGTRTPGTAGKPGEGSAGHGGHGTMKHQKH